MGATAVLAQTAGTDALQWPEAVRPYVALAEAAEAYRASWYQWRIITDEPFDDRPDHKWWVPDHDPMQAVEPVTIDGRSAVLFTTDGRKRGYVAVGEPVRGDFSIELVGRTMTEPACDLSVFADRIGHGPGFQFGSWFNRRNLLWISRSRVPQMAVDRIEPPVEGAPVEPPRTFREIDVPNDRLIEVGRWHRVRMAVCDGTVAGYVDDQLVGIAPIGARHDPQQWRQPLIYLFGTTAAIDRVTVRVRERAEPVDDERAWSRQFGGLSRAVVDGRVAELAALLGHAQWPVRDASQRLLVRLGPLSEPALRQLAASGSPEQQHRARGILAIMGLAAPGRSDADDDAAAE